MTDSGTITVAIAKRRRGIVRGSITRLATRLRDLEGKTDQPSTLDLAQGMALKLRNHDQEYRQHHYSLVELLEDDGDIEREQGTLDDLDDELADLTVRVKGLITACSSSAGSNERKVSNRRLSRCEENIASIRPVP